MRRKLLTLLVAGAGVAWWALSTLQAQNPLYLSLVHVDQDGPVFQRILGTYGQPVGVGQGTAAPTVANTGAPPQDGEVFVISGVASTEPRLQVYSLNSAAWQSAVLSTLATNNVDVANSVWLVSSGLRFEGATADAFEGSINFPDPIADRTFTWPNVGSSVVQTTAIVREEFQFAMVTQAEEDFTAAVVTDTSENFVIFPSAIGWLHYRFEAPGGPGFAGTLEPFNGGALDLDSFTDDVDNEGVDMTFGGDRASVGYVLDEDSNETVYCETSMTIADISETDMVYFGFFLAEAYQDAGAVNGHNTYAIFKINDALGDLDIETELNGGGTLNDDNVNSEVWADTEAHTLRVTMGPDAVTFTLDGTAVTQVNAVLNLDATDQVVCGVGYLNATGDGTPAPGITLAYVEIGRTTN